MIKAEPIDVKDIAEVRSAALLAGKSILVEKPLKDKSNKNSCAITFFEVGVEGTGLLKKLKTKLIMQFLYVHFYGIMDHLKKFDGAGEKEKADYVYYSRAVEMRGILGCQFLYQSPKRACEYLYSCIHQFLELMKDKVKKMTDEEF
jgi:secreted Zn-dependent insulinase-like peptidase